MSRAAAATFIVGALLMLVFDETVTRIFGVLFLLGGIGLGVFAIATPEFTQGSRAEDARLGLTEVGSAGDDAGDHG